MSEPALTVSDARHAYGRTRALDGVSLSVAAGECLGLLGPNGSGKTTLFRILATLLPLQYGQITVCGHDLVRDASAVRRLLGVTFQSPAVDVRLTVTENLRCHGRIYGMSRSDLRQRIGDVLRQFELTDRKSSLVGELSGGMRRRVELAKGILHRPQVLLLDEPGTGLDPSARCQFWDAIDRQRRQYGTTVLVTTHLMNEAESCDSLVLMDQGQVVKSGTPAELTAQVVGDRLTIRCRDAAELRPRLEEFTGQSSRRTDDCLSFHVTNPAELLARVMATFGDEVTSAEVSRATLEDVFLQLTGRRLHDGLAETN